MVDFRFLKDWKNCIFTLARSTSPSPSSSSLKPLLSIVVIGSENVGKTVTLTHLLYQSGAFPLDVIASFEESASQSLGGGHTPANASSEHHAKFKFAWVLEKMHRDPSSKLDIQITRFDTQRYLVQVLDVPGHSDFMKNMVTGTSQGDIALLVVSAVPEELHAGFSIDGQTKEHAMLMYTLGMHQLIVAVNKMDCVNWSQTAFKEAVQETTNVLKKIGYNTRNIPFVPISGALGENLTQPSPHLDWFKGWKKICKSGEKNGITLVNSIDAMEPPKRLPELPLRISIQDVYQVRTNLIPVGRVESGILQAGMEIQVAPSLAKGLVKSVEPGKPDHPSLKAYPGDKTGFLLEDVTLKDIKRGSVCSDATRDPACPVVSFTVSLVAMPHCSKLMKGDKVTVDVHNARAECTVVELIERIDRRNGQVLEEYPKFLKESEAAVLKLVPSSPICIEAFSEYPALGRVALRDQRRTLAVGIIKTVEKKDAEGRTFISPNKK